MKGEGLLSNNDFRKNALCINPILEKERCEKELDDFSDKKLKQAYVSTQRTYLLLGELLAARKKSDQNTVGIPGATANYEGGILKFTVPEVLPLGRYNTSDNRKRWMGLITHAYSEMNKEVRMKHALCIVRTLTPNKQPWDNDNRAAISYVINAIRSLGIVKDDTYEYLSLLQVGGIDDMNPRTEIYLLEKDNPEAILQEMGLFRI